MAHHISTYGAAMSHLCNEPPPRPLVQRTRVPNSYHWGTYNTFDKAITLV